MATIVRADPFDSELVLAFTMPRKLVVRGDSISITGGGEEEDKEYHNYGIARVTCSSMAMGSGTTACTGVTGVTLQPLDASGYFRYTTPQGVRATMRKGCIGEMNMTGDCVNLF